MTTKKKIKTSQNELNKKKRRLEMARFASEHGISAAAREFDTTRKTVRLWANRFNENGETGLSSHTGGVLQKPQPQSKPTRNKNVTRKLGGSSLSFRRKKELIDLNANCNPRSDDYQSYLRVERNKTNANSKRPFGKSKLLIRNRIIQIDALRLNGSSRLCKNENKHNQPQWQFTAFDIQSGGSWIGFSRDNSESDAVLFLELLISHLSKCGLDLQRTNLETSQNVGSGNKENGQKSDKFVFLAEKYFGDYKTVSFNQPANIRNINSFHAQMSNDFYSGLINSPMKNLLQYAHSYMLKYNYEKGNAVSGYLPPFQMFCRIESGSIPEDIFNFPPVVLDNGWDIKSGLRYIVGPIFTLVRAITVYQKKKSPVLLTPNKKYLSAPISSATNQLSHEIKKTCEFVNLQGIQWRCKENRNRGFDNMSRNRREVLYRAEQMLKARKTEADLKKILPITDGEINFVNGKINSKY